LGWTLTRGGFLSDQALRDLNRLAYWVGLPCLLFYRIAGASPEIEAVSGLLIVGAGATLIGILAATIAARALAVPPAVTGTFVQGAFRGNLTFVGLPLVVYALSGDGMSSAGAEASALLMFGPMVVLYNVLAVVVLLFFGGNRPSGVIRSAAGGLATNPILIACVGGLLVALSGASLPVLAVRTLSAIGQMALPLALLCIGGTLYTSRVRGSLRWALVGAGMKVSLVPAAGYALAIWVGLSAEHMRIALILLACPTASASYVLAGQLGGDLSLASSLIVISNLLAVPAMVVVLLVS
jgi:hypothetical protein